MGVPNDNQDAQPRMKVFPLATQITSIVLGFIGFILSVICVSGCSFLEAKPTTLMEEGQLLVISGGLFKYDLMSDWGGKASYSLGCVQYPDTKVEEPSSDPKLGEAASWVPGNASVKAAQAMGTIAAFVAGLAMIICFTMLWRKLPRWLFKSLSYIYFFCLICQLLTFLLVDNDICNGKLSERYQAIQSEQYPDGTNLKNLEVSCNLSTDAYISICASLFYLVLGVMILICPTPDKSVSKAVCGDYGGCGDTRAPQGQQVSPSLDTRSNISIPYNDDAPENGARLTETGNHNGTIIVTEELGLYPSGKKGQS